MAWYLCILIFMTGAIGVGTLSSVPHTFMFMLYIGWTAVRPESVKAVAQGRVARQVRMPASLGARAY
jgi:hypothetical protein